MGGCDSLRDKIVPSAPQIVGNYNSSASSSTRLGRSQKCNKRESCVGRAGCRVASTFDSETQTNHDIVQDDQDASRQSSLLTALGSRRRTVEMRRLTHGFTRSLLIVVPQAGAKSDDKKGHSGEKKMISTYE